MDGLSGQESKLGKLPKQSYNNNRSMYLQAWDRRRDDARRRPRRRVLRVGLNRRRGTKRGGFGPFGQESVDDEVTVKCGHIDAPVGDSQRAVFGECANVVAFGELLAVPEFVGDIGG